MKTTVSVTKEDIAEGCPGNDLSCPIALALRRALDTQDLYVTYMYAYMRWSKDEKYQSATLPKEAQDFITSFDGGKPVQPITFGLQFVQGYGA